MFNNKYLHADDVGAAAYLTALTVIRVSRGVTDASRSLAHTRSFSREGKATRGLRTCGSEQRVLHSPGLK